MYHGHTETCAQGYNDMNLEIFLKCGDVKEWKLFLIMYEDNATKTWLSSSQPNQTKN